MASLGGIWELADVLSRKARRTEGRIPATYLYTDDEGTAWVLLAGADEPTPVTGMVTADLRRGDVVEAVVGGGTVSVSGNVSSPSVGARVVAAAIAPVSAAVTLVSEATDAARDIAEAAQHVANAIGQHFWADDSGIHVTHATQEDWNTSHSGPNVLLNSVGQLFRDGLNNLVAITTEQGARAISFYDGSGNAAGNITAIFSSAIMRIGYPTGNRVEVTSNGVAARSGSSNNYTLVDSTGFKTYLSNALRMLLDGTALRVYDGNGTGTNNVVASFGSTSATIGKSNSYHTVMSSSGIDEYNQNNQLALSLNATSSGTSPLGIDGGDIEFYPGNAYKAVISGWAGSSSEMKLETVKSSGVGTSRPDAYIDLRATNSARIELSASSTNGSSYITVDDGSNSGIFLSSASDVATANTFYNYRHSLVTTTTSIDYDTTLSDDTGGTGIYFREDYGQTDNIGYIRSFGRSGSERLRGLQIGGHNFNHTNWNMLYLLTDKNGNRVVQVSEQAPWRTALGLGSTATMNTIPIANGGTGKTNRADALVALGAAYGAGDTFTDTIHTAGYVTNSGKDIYYTIPLVKGIEGTLTLTSMTLVARQGGSYIVGSASSGTNVKSLATVSRTAHGLGIKVSLSSAPSGVTNNDVVGIACAYAFSVS